MKRIILLFLANIGFFLLFQFLLRQAGLSDFNVGYWTCLLALIGTIMVSLFLPYTGKNHPF